MYVMYREHTHGGMTKIDSHNVDFLEKIFRSIDETKGKKKGRRTV